MRLSLLTPSLARVIDRDRERGATLLVSIAILTLLFIFSIAFVRLVSFERTASANYTDAVRARMLARAGIERAVTEMQRIAIKRHYSHPGDPITAPNVDPLMDPPPTPIPPAKPHDGWGYSDTLQNDSPQKGTYNATTREFTFAGRNFALDLHSTLRPSFRMQDQAKTLYGDRLTYSGLMGSSYAEGADIYKLKVLDTQRMLDLNHPDPVAARRMLKNLLMAIPVPGSVNAMTLARAVMDRRPASGFRSKSEVEALMVNPPGGSGTGLSAEFYRANVRDLITVYAWRDEKVVRPWAVNSIAADITADVGLTTGTVGGAAINLIEPAQRQLTLATQRSPININTAPVPVLVSMFAEAKAVSERFGSFSINFAGAQWLAGQIVARRQGSSPNGPFRTWNEFEAFIDNLTLPAGFTASVEYNNDDAPMFGGSTPPHRRRSEVPTNALGVVRTALVSHNQGCKDLIKAVANPNTMVTKFGMMPNHGGGRLPTGVRIPRLIDKSDITSLTTEGCLDAMGTFEITSIGMVLIPGVDPTDLKIVAAQTEQKVVRVYDIFRITSQQDFEQNRALMIKGDFIEANDNRRDPTTGALNWPYTVHGTNKAAFQNYVVGWPGMVSWPSYSIDRQDRVDTGGNDLPIGIAYTPKSKYVMAHWDGHLTLSNLIAYVMQDMDFVIGFARGKLEAFKVRSWWDPRRQYHTGLGVPDDISNGVDDDADGFIDEQPSRPASQAELTQLATPLNRFELRSRLIGVQNPSEAQMIDEDLTATSSGTANDLFNDGASLWNTGVAIHPYRRYKSAGASAFNNLPQFICYDSGNLDLTRGFSMRFWTQPLADAFLRTEEVLCSFVGSRGNHTGFDGGGLPSYSDRGANAVDADARQVGFRVVKEVTGSQVYITLETLASYAGGACGWVFPGDQASISIDVTPTTGLNNPIQPQWFPGTWHWIVVNCGPRQDIPGTYDVSVQVDMAQYQAASALQFWGSYSAFDQFGEVHGFAAWGPSPYDRYPLDSGYSTSQYFRTPHLLGDWYNCEGGGTLTQNVTTTSNTYGNAVVLDGAGTGYTVGPGWPSQPFPAGSYDHEIILVFTVASGDTSGTTPPPNAPMTQGGTGGFNGWSHTFAGTEMGNDTVPGGHEWSIGVLIRYKTTTYTGAFCNCCEGPPIAGDTPMTTGYSGPDPRNQFVGQAHGCNHDTTGTSKSGYGTVGTWVPPGSFYSGWFCMLLDKAAPPLGTPPASFSGYVPAPAMEFQCDDCHGCESCDIDGPIFFGGEPAGGNYGGQAGQGAAPQSYDVSTMAYAVIDNIVIMNNMQRRTDNFLDANHEFYEDRFYETTMAFLIGNPAGANTPNFGAQYHRGLLELAGRRARIGTLTWTAYPSTENLRFEVGLYRVDAYDAPLPGGGTNFRLDNQTILNGSPAPFSPDPASAPSPATDMFTDSPIGGTAHTAVVTDSVMGFAEAGLNLGGTDYDGEGVPALTGMTAVIPKLLILGVRLKDAPPNGLGTAVAGNGTQGTGGTQPPGVVRAGTTGLRGAAVPQPLLSTPVFEDFTMTLIPDRVTTLYAEEGVEE